MPPAQIIVPLPRLRTALHHRAEHQVAMHTHDATELVLVIAGTVRVDVASKRLDGKCGTLYILPARVPHNQWCAGPWHSLCVLFHHGTHILKEDPRALNVQAETCVQRWMEDLATLQQSESPVPPVVCDSLLHALLSRLSHIEDQRQHSEALHPRLAVAVQHLHEHVTEEIDAAALASRACVSYSHLSALFRARFGCGPLQYQQNLRLELARKLLLNPYLTVDEVADKSGYADTNYFVRLFRQKNGVPPGQWRKQHEGRGARSAN
jgi:AraC-like DNA-binding protein